MGGNDHKSSLTSTLMVVAALLAAGGGAAAWFGLLKGCSPWSRSRQLTTGVVVSEVRFKELVAGSVVNDRQKIRLAFPRTGPQDGAEPGLTICTFRYSTDGGILDVVGLPSPELKVTFGPDDQVVSIPYRSYWYNSAREGDPPRASDERILQIPVRDLLSVDQTISVVLYALQGGDGCVLDAQVRLSHQ